MKSSRGKKAELVAPAGSLEKLRYAFAYGADAAYMGWKRFNLRNMAGNFSLEEIRRASMLKSRMKKKIYLTLNIFPRNEHIEGIIDFLKKLRDIDIDGIVVSDPGVMSLCREYAPYHPIQVSTQANVLNWQTVKAFKKMHAERVILARELSIKEIRDIREKNRDVELEVFVHGALCLSFSGRCHLSKYLTGRDANLGECTHSCRWKYSLVEEKRPGVLFPLEINGQKETFIMNPRDLCLLFVLPHLIGAGVDAFKIEGRMKGIFYVATVVSAYRKALDFIYDKGPGSKEYLDFAEKLYREELLPLKNRMYTADFAGKDLPSAWRKRMHENFERRPVWTNKFIGLVERMQPDGNKVLVFLKNKIENRTKLYYKSRDGVSYGPLKTASIHNARNEIIEKGIAGEKVWLCFGEKGIHSMQPSGILYSRETDGGTGGDQAD